MRPPTNEETIESAELFLYRGDRHLFADSSLPNCDDSAATLVKQRVPTFLYRFNDIEVEETPMVETRPALACLVRTFRLTAPAEAGSRCLRASATDFGARQAS